MDRSQLRSWSRRLAIGAAIAVPGPLLLVILLQNGVNVPFFDEWDWGSRLVALHDGTLSFNDLWHPHNEHRIFFPTLIALGLARIFGWNVLFESVLGIALLTLSQRSLFRMTRDTLGPDWGALTFVLTSLVLFSLGQVENIMWGFQIAWFLVIFCALTTIDLLRSKTSNGVAPLLAACLCCVSSFSSAFGLLVPVIAVFVVATRTGARLRDTAVWIAYAGALAFTYAYHADIERGGLSQMHAAESLVDRFLYVCAYLGSPVAGWSGAHVSVWAGAGGLIWTIVCALVFLGEIRDPQRRLRWVPWIALSAFSLGAAVMTGYGRVGLGIDEALASRYTTLGAQFWLAIVPLTLLVLGTVRHNASEWVRRGSAGVALAAFALLAYGIAQESRTGYETAVLSVDVRSRALAELEADPEAASDSTIRQIYPVPDVVRSVVLRLRRYGDWPLR
jgi:hypothetical protein